MTICTNTTNNQHNDDKQLSTWSSCRTTEFDLGGTYGHFVGTPFIQPRLPRDALADRVWSTLCHAYCILQV